MALSNSSIARVVLLSLTEGQSTLGGGDVCRRGARDDPGSNR